MLCLSGGSSRGRDDCSIQSSALKYSHFQSTFHLYVRERTSNYKCTSGICSHLIIQSLLNIYIYIGGTDQAEEMVEVEDGGRGDDIESCSLETRIYDELCVCNGMAISVKRLLKKKNVSEFEI